MSFKKVPRKNKRREKMDCFCCSRCNRLKQLFPNKELSETYGNFIFYLNNILQDVNFQNIIDELINQKIIHQRTIIYNRKTRSKKTVDKLVWCKNCGIFMEANRYYIEMYLYYLYYLIRLI